MTAIRVGVVWTLLFLVFAFMLSTSEYGERYELKILGVAFLASWAVVSTVAWINWHRELNKYRKFRDAYIRTFPAGEFSRTANKRLRVLAHEVREANEEILLFQSDGLKAFQNRPWYRGMSYNKVGQDLQKNFKRKQKFFYEMYNQLKDIGDLAYISFEADGWKGYAGEPELRESVG